MGTVLLSVAVSYDSQVPVVDSGCHPGRTMGVPMHKMGRAVHLVHIVVQWWPPRAQWQRGAVRLDLCDMASVTMSGK